MSELKLKVCGMRDPENVMQLVKLQPDFIGFIFYEKSLRFVEQPDQKLLSRIPKSIKKVGVFVNEEVDNVLKLHDQLGLDYVQLHGDEDLNFSKKLKERGLRIIKVFGLLDSLPYSLSAFSKYSDYFLFDTATNSYGGSGRHFDWSILNSYRLETPFLLSGGIDQDDVKEIKKLQFECLEGIDVNSKFEITPGTKDIALVKQLKKEL